MMKGSICVVLLCKVAGFWNFWFKLYAINMGILVNEFTTLILPYLPLLLESTELIEEQWNGKLQQQRKANVIRGFHQSGSWRGDNQECQLHYQSAEQMLEPMKEPWQMRRVLQALTIM